MDDQEEPPMFREFTNIYNTLVRCDWNAPILKEHVQKLEAFMENHRELYANKDIMSCIENARGHCRSGGVAFRF